MEILQQEMEILQQEMEILQQEIKILQQEMEILRYETHKWHVSIQRNAELTLRRRQPILRSRCVECDLQLHPIHLLDWRRVEVPWSNDRSVSADTHEITLC